MQRQAYSNEVPMRRVLPLLILLAVVVALVLAAVSALTTAWDVGDIPNWQDPSRLQGVAPALETAPQPALQAYLAQKEEIAHSYAWVDQEQNLARIPIELAMQALAQPDERTAAEREAYLMGAEAGKDKHAGKDAAMRALQAADADASHSKTEKMNTAKQSPSPQPPKGRAQKPEDKP